MLTPPHHQNLHQAVNGTSAGVLVSQACCRWEPTDGWPLRVRSGSHQAQKSQPCEQVQGGSLGANLRSSVKRGLTRSLQGTTGW